MVPEKTKLLCYTPKGFEPLTLFWQHTSPVSMLRSPIPFSPKQTTLDYSDPPHLVQWPLFLLASPPIQKHSMLSSLLALHAATMVILLLALEYTNSMASQFSSAVFPPSSSVNRN